IGAVEARRSRPSTPTTSGSEDLWDASLDAEVLRQPVPTVEVSVGDTNAVVVPERAVVRPRVVSDESGESLPLEDEIRPIVEAGHRGAIRVSGPLGSGKTTTLRHLAAVLPAELGVIFLDDPDATRLAVRSSGGLVVYTSNASTYPKQLGVYRLAPWGNDEL